MVPRNSMFLSFSRYVPLLQNRSHTYTSAFLSYHVLAIVTNLATRIESFCNSPVYMHCLQPKYCFTRKSEDSCGCWKEYVVVYYCTRHMVRGLRGPIRL